MTHPDSAGLSLIELMVTLLAATILLGTAQPHFADLIETRRVSGAAEALQSSLNFARSESITQMRQMVVTYSMNNTANWQAGIRDSTACDPAVQDPLQVDACSVPSGADRILKVLDSDQFPGVIARANRAFTRFEPLRATALGTNVTVSLRSSLGKEVRVIVGPIGRVRTCSPSGATGVPGYAPC